MKKTEHYSVKNKKSIETNWRLDTFTSMQDVFPFVNMIQQLQTDIMEEALGSKVEIESCGAKKIKTTLRYLHVSNKDW